MDKAKIAFAQTLADILQNNTSQKKVDIHKVKEAFLAFGSETPDNLACMAHVTYGTASDSVGYRTMGFRLEQNPLLVSEILNVLEGTQIPPEVKEYYPELTGPEWSAILRFATMVFIAFERP